MKAIKNILAAVTIVGITLFISRYTSDSIFQTVGLCFVAFFALNIIVRNSYAFRSYFTNKFNFFTSKYNSESVMELSSDLAFDKLIEVVQEMKMTVQYSNKEEMSIFATTSISWKSWGENVYIDLVKNGSEETEIKFISTTMFQSYSWGKNEENYNNLVNSIEESLTI